LRILITGGSGLLGGNLAFIAAVRHEVYATYHRHPVVIAGCQMHQLDLTDGRQITRLIESITPHVVVHTAAMTNADECEQRKHEAWQIDKEGGKWKMEGGKWRGEIRGEKGQDSLCPEVFASNGGLSTFSISSLARSRKKAFSSVSERGLIMRGSNSTCSTRARATASQ